MIELDGLNVELEGSPLEPIYVITAPGVTVASVQSFIVSAIEHIDPSDLWNTLNSLEEEAVLKVRGKIDILSAVDIFDEMADAFDYARIDISEFS